MAGLIDAHQLKHKVAQPSEVESDDAHHANPVFFAGEVGRYQQDDDRDWNGGDCQCKLGIRLVCHNYDELDDESQKEEEIEL